MAKSTVIICLLFSILFCCEESPRPLSASITKYPDNKNAALAITFDDGCPSVFTKIVPLLEKYDLKATFFVISGDVEKRNEWENWRTLSKKGNEIANHTLTHRWYLGSCKEKSIFNSEIDSSYRLMTERMRVSPFSFGHPYHSTNPEADKVVFRNHYATRISPDGFCKMLPLFDLEIYKEAMNEAVKNRSWIVTTAHGIDDCYQPLSEEFVDEVLSYAKQRSNDFFIDTFENLAKYKIEAGLTSVSIMEENDNISVALKSSLEPVFDFPLTIAIDGMELGTYDVVSSTNEILKTFNDKNVLYVACPPNASFVVKRK